MPKHPRDPEEYDPNEDEEEEGDNVLEHDELENDEDELEDFTPSQRPTKKRKANADGELEDENDIGSGEAKAGTMASILVENFMCHDKLELKFHKRITFINGPNGSGKSAILTGIQTCLGAKTNETHRGTSIKDLIKAGRDWAQITLKIRNTGVDAFRHDHYGDMITIVRRIDRRTGSSYKIKSASGKTVATTFKELKHMMDQFNLQIDNPTTCMTQDVSREFLANSSAKKKYDFFLRATQLEKMVSEYDNANKNKWELEATLKAKEDKLKESESEVKKLKQEYEESKAMVQMEENILLLRSKIAWALVKERRADFENNKKMYETEKSRVDKYEESMNNQEEVDTNQDEIDRISAETEELKKELGEAKQKSDAHDREIINIGKRKTPFTAEIQDYKGRIKRSQEYIKTCQNEIRDIEKKSKIDRGATVKKLEERLDKLKEQRENFINTSKQENQDMELHDQELQKRSATVSELKIKYEDLKRRIDRIRGQAENLDRQKKDKMQYFRFPVRPILEEINRSRNQFHKLPIGPIGLLINIKDLKWAPAIELALKNEIPSFILSDVHDQVLFKKIIESLYKSRGQQRYQVPTMLIQPFSDRVYDNLQLPQGIDHPTIFSMIELDRTTCNEVPIKYPSLDSLFATIMNTLLNQSGVESSILIEDTTLAQKVMFPRPPHNVRNCYAIDGTRLFMRNNSEVYLGAKEKFSRLWSANKDQQIIDLRREEADLQTTFAEISEQGKAAHQEKKQVDDTMGRLRRKISDTKSNISKLDREVRNVESDLRSEENEISGSNQAEASIAEINHQIQDRNVEIEQSTEIINKAQLEIQSLEKEESQVKQERQELIRSQNRVAEQIKSKSKDLNKLLVEIAQARQRKIEGQRRLQQMKEKFQGLENRFLEITRAKDAAESNTQNIQEIEIKQGETSIGLAKEQERLQRRLQEEQARFGDSSAADIRDMYKSKFRIYEDTRKKILLSKNSLQVISDSLIKRFDRWRDIRTNYAAVISRWFSAYMSQKGHEGTIKVDTEKQELNMQIILDGKTKEGALKKREVEDAKSLSGGERSFSTVALLLSMWQIIDSPTRALDEFDIFMDAMYRKISMNLIIEEAKKSRNQLIIISPHDVSNVKPDKETLKLVKLRPPERNQNQRTMEEFMQSHAQ
ncbi:structural maintenance of chromosomes protein [Acrasis kona]|uniref:Structural maintenance of chromosomes protein n=1 Tax=Acrasis kona TaxID=1008807 RepID=A0AAW2ZH42_9EUKA